MQYKVLMQPSAKADIAEINAWLMENVSLDYADKWLWGISVAVTSLSSFPNRCPISDESDAFDFPVRQLLYGKKPHVYRILFAVENDKVFVLRVRHTKQQRFIDELDEK
jgi:plasmid stabilization system protein ParE